MIAFLSATYAVAIAGGRCAPAQETAQAAAVDIPSPVQQAAAAQTPHAVTSPTEKASAGRSAHAEEPGITEEELKSLLVGKQLFLRGGYLDNSLSFDEHGTLTGHSPQGSYTLSGIQINKVRLSKRKVELEGDRYGLHFLGELPYEDPSKALDRVNITPKKKVVRITIDREIVVKPKEKKVKKEKGKAGHNAAKPAATAPEASDTAAGPAAPTEAEDANTSKHGTTTESPAHATKVLKEALDNIFAQGFDERMLAAMPPFWKLYYQAAAEKSDYRPNDANVLRQSAVDQKAKLITKFEPPSNEYAQDHGVAGMCLYHVVIDADGRPGEIAVARPIGFGLDESAVESIRKAKFEPAIKDGKPVSVMLDLVVQFRIYSKRTAVAGNPNQETSGPILPGPYSVEHE